MPTENQAPEGGERAVMEQALAAIASLMEGSTLHDDGDGWGTICMPKPAAMTLGLSAVSALRAALAAQPQAPLSERAILDLVPSTMPMANDFDLLWFARAVERAHGIHTPKEQP